MEKGGGTWDYSRKLYLREDLLTILGEKLRATFKFVGRHLTVNVVAQGQGSAQSINPSRFEV